MKNFKISNFVLCLVFVAFASCKKNEIEKQCFPNFENNISISTPIDFSKFAEMTIIWEDETSENVIGSFFELDSIYSGSEASASLWMWSVDRKIWIQSLIRKCPQDGYADSESEVLFTLDGGVFSAYVEEQVDEANSTSTKTEYYFMESVTQTGEFKPLSEFLENDMTLFHAIAGKLIFWPQVWSAIRYDGTIISALPSSNLQVGNENFLDFRIESATAWGVPSLRIGIGNVINTYNFTVSPVNDYIHLVTITIKYDGVMVVQFDAYSDIEGNNLTLSTKNK
ncbi:MAG: hypothetical protein P8P30_10940 [Rickettsiales bacterium]|nr:hypothetical protein [Rickettsiales bacterium]